MYKRFLLSFALVFPFACSTENRPVAEKTDVDNGATRSAVAQFETDPSAELELRNLETEYLKKLNGERDRNQRRAVIDQYLQRFHELALKYPDSRVADQAWHSVLWLGEGPIKEEAMNRQLEMAQANPDSGRAVELLATVVDCGVGPQKSIALDRLYGIAMSEQPTEVSLKGLAALAASFAIEVEIREAAVDRLLKRHIEDPIVLDVIEGMSSVNADQNAEVEKWLKAICHQASGENQAKAVVTLARILKRRDEQKKYWLGEAAAGADSKRREDKLKELPESYLAYLRRPLDSGENQQLEKWLMSVVENGDLFDSELNRDARRYLFAIQNLAIGKQAPEIVGTDLDGDEFKLSDYRGKVVLLTFWADS